MDETYFITVIINHVKYELLGKKKKKKNRAADRGTRFPFGGSKWL